MIESESIYLDLKALRRVLMRAKYMMQKEHRIEFATPAISLCVDCLVAFEMAYDFREERNYYAKALKSRFIALKLLTEDMMELHLVSEKNGLTGEKANTVNMEIIRLVGSIDKGIGRYVGSIFKGKTSIETRVEAD